MKYLIIAGEASGDLHASHFIKTLLRDDPAAEIRFFGGDMMAEVVGTEPIVHYQQMAYMGFSEVLRHLPDIRRNMRLARQTLEQWRPDRLVCVDYPGFNLKLARHAARLGVEVVYYISPKLWAWKAWRVRAVRKYVSRMLCILPFEPAWYAARGYDRAVYVGNPSVAEVDEALAAAPGREEFLAAHGLRQRPLIVLMPGSRRGEIRCNLPVMDAAARQFPQYTIVVAGAPGIPGDFYASLTRFKVVQAAQYSLLRHAHAAMVTSGTATLETALAGVPQVVLYRSNGSRLAYEVMKRVLSVEFVSLPNLILGREGVPELLLHQCTPEGVAEALRALTPANSADRVRMLADYGAMRAALTAVN